MKIKKQYYLLILLAIVLLIVISGITLALFAPKPIPENESVNVITPTPPLPSPPTMSTNPGAPPVSYSSDATDRLLEKVENHPELSTADSAVKQKILSLLPQGKQSGYLYESPTVRIEYLISPDVFLVEIMTTNIGEAKTAAAAWFKSQGLSQTGICDLPISFYINKTSANELRNSNLVFSPLPDGC